MAPRTIGVSANGARPPSATGKHSSKRRAAFRATSIALSAATLSAVALSVFAAPVPLIAAAGVCGYDDVTYADRAAALAAGTGVLHCGACGACSNAHDIAVLNETRDTLTDDSTVCAAINIFSSSRAADCLADAADFTDACADCWLDNFDCTFDKCAVTCFGSIINGDFSGKNLTSNDCLACDEENCGPPFIECAGANRRRAGIISDIDREDEEVCTIVGYVDEEETTGAPTAAPSETFTPTASPSPAPGDEGTDAPSAAPTASPVGV